MTSETEDIWADLQAVMQLSDYEAVEVLWVALVKAANRMRGPSEHRRMLALVSRMSVDEISKLLSRKEVDALINLDPPLETALADPHERLYAVETKEALEVIQASREKDQMRALQSLGEILKRIRNKRAHGFKARKGPRDAEILGAARPLLADLCRLALAVR